MKKVILSLLLALSLKSFAGVGLSVNAVRNFSNGYLLSAAIGGGLGAASISSGLGMIATGRVGWGTFFTVLEREEIINATDREVLENADLATREVFLEIIGSDLSQEEKEEALLELF